MRPRCRQASIQDVANELHLDWHTVKELDKQYMREQIERAGTPGPMVIGIDELSIRKRHTYRIMVSDLISWRPIWFGGQDRSDASMHEFYRWLGDKKSRGIRLAGDGHVEAVSKCRGQRCNTGGNSVRQVPVLRHLGEALDHVRKSEYARVQGKQRRFIKGQKYTPLSNRDNLTLQARRGFKTLLAANKRLNTAYLLKESFGQLWSYEREAWARRFFENWKAVLKWQRLKPYEKFAQWLSDIGIALSPTASREQSFTGFRGRT